MGAENTQSVLCACGLNSKIGEFTKPQGRAGGTGDFRQQNS